jgi:twinkle protein
MTYGTEFSGEIMKVLDSNPEEKKTYKKGIYKASDYADSMKLSFKKGKPRGETTYFRSIDPHMTWKRGFLYAWTGFPNHGKTEMILQLALARSIYAKKKWVIFCPENMGSDEKGNLTPEEIYDTLIHSYIGKTTDPYYGLLQMSEAEYNRGIEFVDKYFTVIYPEELKTADVVLKYFDYVVGTEGADGCILDPWNKVIHNYSGLLDEYLASKFAMIKDFAIRKGLVFNFVEHPRGGIVKNKDGSLPVPDGYNLRGGAMWLNAMDVIVAAHRPNFHADKTDQAVQLHVHKVKNQKLVGIPGVIELTFDRKTNRYNEENGDSPLNGWEIPVAQQPINFYEKDKPEVAPF